MKEIKQRKERRFLKTLGRVGEILVEQVLLKLGSSIIKKIGGKKTLPSILFLLASLSLFAQFPNTGNKQRLGFQTTGDGLVWRGALSDTASIQPINNQSAWVILDTVNLKMYSFDFTSNVWNLVGGAQGLTMPFDSITFNTAKNGTVGVGEVEYNDTQGSLIQGLKGGNVTNVIGQQLHQRVNNRTGAPLAKGDVVYLAGSQGNRITVAKGLAVTDAFSANTFGVVAESIADNASGFIITEGLITGLNTSALTEDSAVYLSPTVAGALTSTKPQAPQHSVYIGVCVKSNNGSGELFVKIRNGQELDELHDTRITNPVTGATLYYSGGLWRDTTAALLVSDTASMLIPYLRKLDTITLSNRINTKLNISDTASMLLPYLRDADTVTLSNRINIKLNIADTSAFARDNQISGTSGQVAYFNLSSSVVSDTALRWSAANKSLGINMTTVPLGANLIIKNSQEPVRTTVVATQTFAADTTNWTRGAGWTFNGTQAVATAATGNLTYTAAFTIVAGNGYEVTYSNAYTSGTLTLNIGDAGYQIPSIGLNGQTIVLYPTSATGGLRFTTSSFTGILDNISIVQIANPSPILFAGQDDGSATLYNNIRMPNRTTFALGGGGLITTGINNLFFGNSAGLNNTSGNGNNFFGLNAGLRNTVGIGNNFFGNNAGRGNTSGGNNNFYGNNAGQSNISGANNNFFGESSGFNNLTGENNNFFGNGAGASNTSGGNNNFFGVSSGLVNINGSNNNFFGNNAGASNTSGGNNNFFGQNSAFRSQTGSHNNFFGVDAGFVNRTGSFNISIGYRSMNNTLLSDTLSGSNNIIIGPNTGSNISAAAAGNVAIGNAVNLPTKNGSDQGVYQNVLFFTGASGTGTTIAAASKAGIKTNAPNRDLEVAGEVRITDLTTDTPTRLVGADADGDLGQVTLGAGLSLVSSSLLADTSFLVTRFDTASMLTPYFRDADTTSLNLTSRFAAKLNLSDTASMLTNYLRSGTAASTYLTQSNAASTYLPLTGGTLSGDLGISKSSNSILRLSSADVSSYGKLIFSSNNGGFLNYGASIESSGDGVGVDVGSLNFLTGYGTVRTNRMTITPTGNLTIVNSATIGGTLGVTGATTLNNGLNITGTTNILNGQPFSTLNIIPAPTIGSTDNTIQTINTTGLSFKIGTTERMKLNSSGLLTVTDAATFNSSAVFNEGSTDSDFRVESDGNANMVFVDASTDRVGIGYASPTKTLDVNGEVRINTVTATPTSLLGKDGSNVVGEVTTVAQTGLMTRGETTATTGSPSATFTVTHGLGSTPTSVLVTSAGLAGAEKIIFEVYTKNSTTFSVQAWNYDGTEASSKSVKIFWLAIK